MKLLIFLLPISLFINEVSAANQTWQFDVLLYGKRIGSHTIQIDSRGAEQTVDIKVAFDVDLLLFSAYTYLHKNREIWRSGCLKRLDATTNDDGEKLWVKLEQLDTETKVATPKRNRVIPTHCVKSFAYWDRSILEANKLLNTQTGEYMAITVKKQPDEKITIRGKTIQSSRYHIATSKFTIDLWYSQNGDWVGLESTMEDGNTLKYVLK